MASKYWGPLKWLGGSALVAFIISIVFPAISNALLTEEMRKAVLVNAIPFFAAFVGILLLFILLIFIIALRYNGQVPARTHSSMEQIIIGGIVFGVVCLFQPWSQVPYRYGFLLVLASMLSFIVWSHVTPGAKGDDVAEPVTLLLWGIRAANTLAVILLFLNTPVLGFLLLVLSLLAWFTWGRITTLDQVKGQPGIGLTQNIIGAVAGLIVVALLAAGAISVNAPVEPYGVRQRVWNSYDDAKKADIAAAAQTDFQSVELPFLVVFNLFPGLLVFFIVREALAERKTVTAGARVPAPAGGD